MEKPTRVKIMAEYIFPTEDEAEAFADFKRAEGVECPELHAISVEVVKSSKKQPA